MYVDPSVLYLMFCFSWGARVGDYVTGVQSTNYGQIYKNLNELVEKINSKILSYLVMRKETPSTSR